MYRSSAASSAAPPIDPRVLQEMNQLGLAVVKIRLAAALQMQRERVPVQRPGVLGEAPTCNQVIEWVSFKEAKKERKAKSLQRLTLAVAVIAALAAVSAALIPPDHIDAAILRIFGSLFHVWLH
jgi:hypothetical protein